MLGKPLLDVVVPHCNVAAIRPYRPPLSLEMTLRRVSTAILFVASLVPQPLGQTTGSGWTEAVAFPASESPVELFNGHDLTGWEGQTETYWSVESGLIKGGNRPPQPGEHVPLHDQELSRFPTALRGLTDQGTKLFHDALGGGSPRREVRGHWGVVRLQGAPADVLQRLGYLGCASS